jgi:hypothetical protein
MTRQLVAAGFLLWIAMLQASIGGIGPEWAPGIWIWLSGCSIGALLGAFVARERR